MFTVKASNGKFVSMHPFYKDIVVGSKPKMYRHRGDARIQMFAIQDTAKSDLRACKKRLAVVEQQLEDGISVLVKLNVRINDLSHLPYREVADKIEKLEGRYRSAMHTQKSLRENANGYKRKIKRLETIVNLDLSVASVY